MCFNNIHYQKQKTILALKHQYLFHYGCFGFGLKPSRNPGPSPMLKHRATQKYGYSKDWNFIINHFNYPKSCDTTSFRRLRTAQV